MLAGGLESMTNAPYLLPKARGGYRMGHGEVLDHMFYDGLQSPFDGKLMGCFADATAAQIRLHARGCRTRSRPSPCARALRAVESGEFDAEDHAGDRQGPQGRDRGRAATRRPAPATSSKIPTLKPAFGKDGTVTAASSSSISDGAAALVADDAQRRHATAG